MKQFIKNSFIVIGTGFGAIFGFIITALTTGMMTINNIDCKNVEKNDEAE